MLLIPAIFLDYNIYIIFINVAFICILEPYCAVKSLSEDEVTIFNVIIGHTGSILTHFWAFNCIFLFLKLSGSAQFQIMLRSFYDKITLQKENQAVLNNLCEALFSFDTGGLTYFNQLGKNILRQCVLNKEEMLPNGTLLEKLQSFFALSKSIEKVQKRLQNQMMSAKVFKMHYKMNTSSADVTYSINDFKSMD